MDKFDLSRRLAAEALGTGILVATVVGSGIMAETLTKRCGACAPLQHAADWRDPRGLNHGPRPDFGCAFQACSYACLYGQTRAPGSRSRALRHRADRGRHRGHHGSASDVWTGGPRPLDEDADRRRSVVRRGRRGFWPRCNYLGWHPLSAECGATARRTLHHCRLLVHGFHILRQSGRGDRPIDLPGFIVAELLGAILASMLMNWLLGRPEVRGPVRIAEETSP